MILNLVFQVIHKCSNKMTIFMHKQGLSVKMTIIREETKCDSRLPKK